MKKLIALCLVLALCGCGTSGILKSTEPQEIIYTLRPVESAGKTSAAPAKILEILPPSVPPGMDRERIALYLDRGQKLDYYAAARWSSSLENLIGEFTRRSASAVLPYLVSVTPDQNIDPDFRMQVKINELQPVYSAAAVETPQLRANVEFTLVDTASEKILSNFVLTKIVAADNNRLDDIVRGLETLLREIEVDAFKRLDPKLRAEKFS